MKVLFLKQWLLIAIIFFGSVELRSQQSIGPNQKVHRYENSVKYVNGYKVVNGERPPINLGKVPTNAYEPGKIFIKLKPSKNLVFDESQLVHAINEHVKTGHPEVDALNKAYGVFTTKPILYDLYKIDGNAKLNKAKHKAWEFNLWFEVYFDSNKDVKKAVEDFMNLPEVEMAEPIFKKRLIEPVFDSPIKNAGNSQKVVPNDPHYPTYQWALNNTGQVISNLAGSPGIDLRIEDAWEIEMGNSNLIVSVHDGGVDYDHPDLINNMWVGIGPDGNFTKSDNHGTHVAGTIAAVTNNGVGVAGIAGGSGSGNGVRIMSVDVFEGTLTTYGGYVFAADNGSAISQNSWAYIEPNVYNTTDLNGIDYFNENGGGDALLEGGIVIFAAGNDNDNGAWYPGYYSGTMAVASHTNTGNRSGFSNFGSWVDITAPGSGIVSTYVVTDDGSYGFMSGTSMACPHVSGVAALIVSKYYGDISKDQLWDALIEGVDDIYQRNPTHIGQLGSGRTNAYKAILAAEKRFYPKVVTSSVTSILAETATVISKVNNDGGYSVDERGVVWSTQENPTLENNEGFTVDGDGLGDFTSNIIGLQENTQYFVSAYATNSQGTTYGNSLSFFTPNMVTFIVVDNNKNPIENASINIDNETKSTAISGQTTFHKLYGTYNYAITANGFNPTGGRITVDPNENTIKIVLIAELSDSPTVKGEQNACIGSEIIYRLSDSGTGLWEIEGGALIGDPSNQSISAIWTETSGVGIIRYREIDNEEYHTTYQFSVAINTSNVLVISDRPRVHKKGNIPILICTKPDLNYKWFKDGALIEGELQQHFAPRGQAGRFQVQVIDQNQCPNTSSEVRLTATSINDDAIYTYPNPSKGQFNVNFESTNLGNGTISILNSYGKVIHQERFTKSSEILNMQLNFPSLSKGIYLIKINVGNNEPVVSKITVN
jgi:subtilisin family serine protease